MPRIISPRTARAATACTLLFALADLGCHGGLNNPPAKNDAGGTGGGSDGGGARPDVGSEPTAALPPLGRDIPRPKVHILTPLPGALYKTMSISVTGTASADATMVTVKGVQATLSGGRFTADGVVLREGENAIIAEAKNDMGGSAMDSVSVMLDTVSPLVSFRVPQEGDQIAGTSIMVVGTIRDPGGRQTGLRVSVNGTDAQIERTDFFATVTAPLGDVTLDAMGTDAAGNITHRMIHVHTHAMNGPLVTAAAGNLQHAPVGAVLAEPLVAAVTDMMTGRPVAGRRIQFDVLRGDGMLDDGTHKARSLILKSDATGRASVRFRIGSRSGTGANVVKASVPGFDGQALFIAKGDTGLPTAISAEKGETQRGTPGEHVPKPLVVKVVDEHHNGVAGVEVRFKVLSGGGSFDGQGTSTSTTTDANGSASIASWRLGPDEGLVNNLVQATFEGNGGSPAIFQATAVFPGLVSETRVTGEIFDMAQQPLAGVKVRITPAGQGQIITAITDQNGGFGAKGTATGLITLVLDTSGVEGGVYPPLNFELIAIAGRNNRLPHPIYLPKLDMDRAIAVSPTRGGTISVAGVPGAQLYVAPGSVTFKDGSMTGSVSMTLVNHARVPMRPGSDANGVLDVTIQPDGAHFDPPARIRLPNIDGYAPGQLVDLMGFNHQLLEFVAVGTLRVTADGTTLESEPGQGVIAAGWHGQGQNAVPTGIGAGFCPTGNPPLSPDELQQTQDLSDWFKNPTLPMATPQSVAAHNSNNGLGDPASFVETANNNCTGALRAAGTLINPADRAANSDIGNGFTWALDKAGCGKPKEVSEKLKKWNKVRMNCQTVGCCDPNCAAFVFDAADCDKARRSAGYDAHKALCTILAACQINGFCDVSSCGSIAAHIAGVGNDNARQTLQMLTGR